MNTRTVRRLRQEVTAAITAHREKIPYLAIGVVLLGAFVISKGRENTTYIYKNEREHVFKDGRIMSFQGGSIYEGKERLFTKTVAGIQANETAVKEQLGKLQAKIEELEHPKPEPSPTPSPNPPGSGPPDGEMSREGTNVGSTSSTVSIRVSDPPDSQSAVRSSTSPLPRERGAGRASPIEGSGLRRGASILSFPVKESTPEQAAGVVLPPGSYVKAKLMTGIEAPEGKTSPVLLQLDYAFIGPNRHRIDLSGCFMIAKSQGDLSTERVQMQATKLSCVSKDGKMFERDVSGFVADDKDNSFAIMGSVNSKQDRVAAMAFLSSIVAGVGQAIQQAQTTSQTTALGGSQSVMTGSGAEYMAAGGASNAASLVTQWYLKQAQSLLPSISVGSGADVWVVMLETVKLPNAYFRKNEKGDSDEGAYLYLTRVLD